MKMNSTYEEDLSKTSWNTFPDGNMTPALNVTLDWMGGPTGKIIDQAINIISSLVLCLTMVSLGCTMELSKIKSHVLKPKGVLIAMFAQYGIMPLTAFGLTKLFRLSSIESLAVLICGCCPGGTLSNILSLALDGDMNLSIAMTTFSTVLALGMMPLLLYLYCKGMSFIHKVPYKGITITLALILIPCGFGIFLNYKFPKHSKTITKVGLLIVLLLVVIIGVLSGISNRISLWSLVSAQLMGTSALMPMIGYSLGYILSSLFRLSERCKRTISMETGCQNVQLCTTILKVTFPPEDIGILYLFPLIFLLFQITEAFIFIVIYRAYERIKKSAGKMFQCIYVPVQNTVEHVTLSESENPNSAMFFNKTESSIRIHRRHNPNKQLSRTPTMPITSFLCSSKKFGHWKQVELPVCTLTKLS
ncbi:sodium/bile acid cotransporter [Callorhinchus milii]|uniref:sodium/bile acid cotransporter n=1 Tax=Callorhinchus milii TaxID=7868 RepID=UPI001C3F772A|nr:sodium/bile acid cotransporter [Callorhinchus milii]